MSGRGARGRPTQSRLIYVCIGFVLGAIFSTVIQNISDNHLELYHQSVAQLEGTSSESEDIIAASSCGLPDRCGKLNYGAEDPISALSAKAPMIGWHFKDLRLDILPNGTAAKFTVSDSCYNSLDDGEAPPIASVTSSLVAHLNHTASEKKLKKSCKTIDDNILIISDTLGRAPENMFDELSVVWYHFWLLKKAACSSGTNSGRGGGGGRWVITHLNGLLNDQPPRYPRGLEQMRYASTHVVPFPGMLSLLGEYVPWQELVKGAEGKCLKFRQAATTGSSWLWLNKPLPSQANYPLIQLVDAILEELGVGGPRTGRCNYTLLYASRAGAAARRVLNEEQLLERMRSVLPDFTVKSVDLGSLPFPEQVAAVRAADVFVLPHGGAGPHVLWLHHGAVVIELFPYNDADPMYRNMAVQTGKSYLSWQASSFAVPFEWETMGLTEARDAYHFTNVSDYKVNLSEVEPLLTAAGAMVRNTIGTNWFPSAGKGAGRPYSAFLCTMCPKKGRNHTCKA